MGDTLLMVINGGNTLLAAEIKVKSSDDYQSWRIMENA